MPASALQALRALTQQLGREPSFTELLHFIGADPAGQPMPPHPDGPVQLQDERGHGPLSALLAAQEMREQNPEIEEAQERLIRELLFGPDRGGQQRSLFGQYGAPTTGHSADQITFRRSGTTVGGGFGF